MWWVQVSRIYFSTKYDHRNFPGVTLSLSLSFPVCMSGYWYSGRPWKLYVEDGESILAWFLSCPLLPRRNNHIDLLCQQELNFRMLSHWNIRIYVLPLLIQLNRYTQKNLLFYFYFPPHAMSMLCMTFVYYSIYWCPYADGEGWIWNL